MVAGSALPWLIGVVCSVVASVDYEHLVDFDVCRQSVVYRRQMERGSAVGWTGALAVIYWLMITLAGAWLAAGYFWNRKLLTSMLPHLDQTMASGPFRTERRRTSCISATGASLSDIAAADAEEMSRHNSSKKKRQARKQSGERVSRSSQVRALKTRNSDLPTKYKISAVARKPRDAVCFSYAQ